jgi:uncharacterized iron-regulated membrane protein
MSPAARKPLLAFHLWAGITAGVVLIFIAVTGAALVFRDSFERRMDTERFVVTPGATRLGPDALIARAQAARPGAELESVRYYGDPTAPFLVYFRDKHYVHLNPYTGSVLGVRARYGEGFGWVEGLHKYLVFPPSDIGERVNGSFALLFLAIIATGLVLWWPATRKALAAALTLNSRLQGRPRHLNQHKVFGFYAGLVLIVSAVTSLPIAFDSVKASLYPLTGSVKRPVPLPVAKTESGTVAGFDVVARAMAAWIPNARETYIPLPKNGVVAAYAIAADAPHTVARSYAWFDGATGQQLRAQPFAEAPLGFRVYYWMMALHLGAVGGWAWRAVLLFGALAVPFLAWTGLASYLALRAKRQSRAVA